MSQESLGMLREAPREQQSSEGSLVAGAGPSPWPYLVRGKFSELFIQTDIFQALTPRAALQMIPEEVFV